MVSKLVSIFVEKHQRIHDYLKSPTTAPPERQVHEPASHLMHLKAQKPNLLPSISGIVFITLLGQNKSYKL